MRALATITFAACLNCGLLLLVLGQATAHAQIHCQPLPRLPWLFHERNSRDFAPTALSAPVWVETVIPYNATADTLKANSLPFEMNVLGLADQYTGVYALGDGNVALTGVQRALLKEENQTTSISKWTIERGVLVSDSSASSGRFIPLGSHEISLVTQTQPADPYDQLYREIDGRFFRELWPWSADTVNAIVTAPIPDTVRNALISAGIAVPSPGTPIDDESRDALISAGIFPLVLLPRLWNADLPWNLQHPLVQPTFSAGPTLNLVGTRSSFTFEVVSPRGPSLDLFRAVTGFHVCGRVWWDLDMDGIQGASEAGVPDVGVQLRYFNHDRKEWIRLDTKTNPLGCYCFEVEKPGVYEVIFEQPINTRTSPYHQGPDRTIDSDVHDGHYNRIFQPLSVGGPEDIEITVAEPAGLFDMGIFPLPVAKFEYEHIKVWERETNVIYAVELEMDRAHNATVLGAILALRVSVEPVTFDDFHVLNPGIWIPAGERKVIVGLRVGANNLRQQPRLVSLEFSSFQISAASKPMTVLILDDDSPPETQTDPSQTAGRFELSKVVPPGTIQETTPPEDIPPGTAPPGDGTPVNTPPTDPSPGDGEPGAGGQTTPPPTDTAPADLPPTNTPPGNTTPGAAPPAPPSDAPPTITPPAESDQIADPNGIPYIKAVYIYEQGGYLLVIFELPGDQWQIGVWDPLRREGFIHDFTLDANNGFFLQTSLGAISGTKHDASFRIQISAGNVLTAVRVHPDGIFRNEAGLYAADAIAGEDWEVLALLLPDGTFLFYSEFEGDGVAGRVEFSSDGTFSVGPEISGSLAAAEKRIAVTYREGLQIINFALERVAVLRTIPLRLSLQPTATGQIKLTWPSAAGTEYDLQTSADLAKWQSAGAPVRGDGSVKEITLSPSGSAVFYRLLAHP